MVVRFLRFFDRQTEFQSNDVRPYANQREDPRPNFNFKIKIQYNYTFLLLVNFIDCFEDSDASIIAACRSLYFCEISLARCALSRDSTVRGRANTSPTSIGFATYRVS